MNLLMISGDRSVLSGKQGAFWYTLEALRRHFDRIDVLCPRAHVAGIPGFDLFENVFIHPAPKGLLRQPSWIVRRGKELIAEHHHVMMTVQEYPPFYNGRGAMRLHRLTGVPYVLEVHHVVGHPTASSPVEWIGRKLSPYFLCRHARDAFAVRTVNGETKTLLQTFGIPGEKIAIVPSFYLDAALAAIPAPAHPSYDVAFCGRVVVNKGLPRLIDALAHIPKATLAVIGDGPLLSNCKSLVRVRNMEDRVRFLGWLPTQQDVWTAMRSAKVLVMPSLSEGGPRVALEAMACGLPVISTRVGVMPDVIRDGENGVFTDGSPSDLHAKILLLLEDNSLRQTIGENARKILERFEREKLIGEYADFLKKAAGAETRSHV